MVLLLAIYVSVAWGYNGGYYHSVAFILFYFSALTTENKAYNVARKDLLPLIHTARPAFTSVHSQRLLNFLAHSRSSQVFPKKITMHSKDYPSSGFFPVSFKQESIPGSQRPKGAFLTWERWAGWLRHSFWEPPGSAWAGEFYNSTTNDHE